MRVKSKQSMSCDPCVLPPSRCCFKLEKFYNGTLKSTTTPKGSIKPPQSPIEPQQGFIGFKRFYQMPIWPPKRFYRTLVNESSEPQTGFYRTFRTKPRLFRLPFQNFPYLEVQNLLKTCAFRSNSQCSTGSTIQMGMSIF